MRKNENLQTTCEASRNYMRMGNTSRADTFSSSLSTFTELLCSCVFVRGSNALPNCDGDASWSHSPVAFSTLLLIGTQSRIKIWIIVTRQLQCIRGRMMQRLTLYFFPRHCIILYFPPSTPFPALVRISSLVVIHPGTLYFYSLGNNVSCHTSYLTIVL